MAKAKIKKWACAKVMYLEASTLRLTPVAFMCRSGNVLHHIKLRRHHANDAIESGLAAHKKPKAIKDFWESSTRNLGLSIVVSDDFTIEAADLASLHAQLGVKAVEG